jgi:hypothetical protein
MKKIRESKKKCKKKKIRESKKNECKKKKGKVRNIPRRETMKGAHGPWPFF